MTNCCTSFTMRSGAARRAANDQGALIRGEAPTSLLGGGFVGSVQKPAAASNRVNTSASPPESAKVVSRVDGVQWIIEGHRGTRYHVAAYFSSRQPKAIRMSGMASRLTD